MTLHDPKHLTADELDALLTDSSSALVTSHLATCAACASMVEADGRIIGALHALPLFDPSDGFADAVVGRVKAARLAAAELAPVPLTPRAIAARRRGVGALMVTAVGIAGGFAWSVAHPAATARLTLPALRASAEGLWASAQALIARADGHEWFSPLRDVTATPGRAVLVLIGVAAIYAVALTGFQRLMTEPVADASF